MDAGQPELWTGGGHGTYRSFDKKQCRHLSELDLIGILELFVAEEEAQRGNGNIDSRCIGREGFSIVKKLQVFGKKYKHFSCRFLTKAQGIDTIAAFRKEKSFEVNPALPDASADFYWSHFAF